MHHNTKINNRFNGLYTLLPVVFKKGHWRGTRQNNNKLKLK